MATAGDGACQGLQPVIRSAAGRHGVGGLLRQGFAWRQGPDAKTIWLFGKRRHAMRAKENLAARFDKRLTKAGRLAMAQRIIETTSLAQPGGGEEKAAIGAGKVAEACKDKSANATRLERQAQPSAVTRCAICGAAIIVAPSRRKARPIEVPD